MLPRVYIETTVVSYLTARPSRDLIVAAYQQITRDWWDHCRGDYELCASGLVVQEASEGDPTYVQRRLETLSEMVLLEARQQAVDLAEELVRAGALPTKAFEDALHIAIATDHSVPYLLTWNLRHMANANMRRLIEKVCCEHGYKAPIICTPEELKKVQP